jgi:inorganic pyrophosphatase
MRMGAVVHHVLTVDSVATCLQIIAVHADDPEYSGFDDISQIPKHRLAEIKRL